MPEENQPIDPTTNQPIVNHTAKNSSKRKLFLLTILLVIILLGISILLFLRLATPTFLNSQGQNKVTPTTTPVTYSSNSPKETIYSLKSYLQTNSPVTEPDGSTFEWDNDDGSVVLIDRDAGFSLQTAETSSNHLYGDIKVIDDVTEEFINALDSKIRTFFLNQGFTESLVNKYIPENHDNGFSNGYGYFKGDIYCSISLSVLSNPYAGFVCGKIDKIKTEELQPFLKAFNPSNDKTMYVGVTKISGNFAKLSIGGKYGGGGYYVIAMKDKQTWKEIFSGQEAPNCTVVDQYQIPKEIYDNCYIGDSLRF